MKYTDLIKGQWYSGISQHSNDLWIFKFKGLKNKNEIYISKCGTPIDNYTDRSEGHLDCIINLNFAESHTVLSMFPEEREEQFKKEIMYEIY